MRRLVSLTRPFSALFALWFAIVLGDPGMLHSCPMHGAHGGHSPATTTASSAHGGHGSHGAAANASTSRSDQQHAPATCTCVGHCCATTPATPLPTVAAIPVPVMIAAMCETIAVASPDVPASPGLRLPFANGPPIV